MQNAKIAKTKSAPRLLLVGAVLAVFLITWHLSQSGLACEESYRPDAEIRFQYQSLMAQIAKSDAELDRGLGGRRCIGDSQAMLFVFSSLDKHAFWMKDMQFPIDIVWLDESRKIVDFRENVTPDTYPEAFIPSTSAQYVIELSAGGVKRYSLGKGDVVDIKNLLSLGAGYH